MYIYIYIYIYIPHDSFFLSFSILIQTLDVRLEI